MKKLELWEVERGQSVFDEEGKKFVLVEEDDVKKICGLGNPVSQFLRFNNITENVKEIAKQLNKEDFSDYEDNYDRSSGILIEYSEKVEKIKAKIKEITGISTEIERGFDIGWDDNLFLWDTEESVLGFIEHYDDGDVFFDFLEYYAEGSDNCIEYFDPSSQSYKIILDVEADVYKLEVSNNSVELDYGNGCDTFVTGNYGLTLSECVRKIFTIDGEKVEGEYLFIASNDYKIINRERLIECLEHLKQESCEEVDIEEYLELIDELK